MKEIKSKSDLAINGAPPAFNEKLHVGRPNIGHKTEFLKYVEKIFNSKLLSNNGLTLPNMKKFIIYAPPYDPDSGGAIVLYKLAAILKELGYSVSIWHSNRPLLSEAISLTGIKKYIRFLKGYFLYHKAYKSPYMIGPSFGRNINESIVVYPEVVSGNPLKSKYVVRWLLNKPGFFTNEIEYGKDDLFFFYHEYFRDTSLSMRHEAQLNVIELNKDIYQQKNFGERTGMCVMLRKGKNRKLDQHDESAIVLDGMSHEAIAEVFNRCKYFVSYDLYTMYSRYAALCGCLPVVIPEAGLTKEKWRPQEVNRYGIAYGWDDLAWAKETRENLIRYSDECEERAIQSVKDFVKTINEHY